MVLDRLGLNELVTLLRADGYRVVGPTVRDETIVLAELASGADLPDGWGVETGPGHYRLHRRSDSAVFAHSAGAQSWKQFLHPSKQRLFSLTGNDFTPEHEEPVRYAFLGVRGCDLAAIATLGGVLGRGAHPDGSFTRRMQGLVVIAVGCTEPGGVCFCASMGTGPAPGPGYDLSLTERIEGDDHRFLVQVGTEVGAQILDRLPGRAAGAAEVADANAALAEAASRMGREMPPGDIRTLLADSRQSARWQDVADRCLTCGNCTMVCPTCFCTTTEDTVDLGGQQAELDFSYLHGGSVRVSGESRYRQWITHKLSSWHDQFGSSGCVGCGRCIAWCPTGIDITAEVAALAAERDAGTAEL
jgi:ferredoxin